MNGTIEFATWQWILLVVIYFSVLVMFAVGSCRKSTQLAQSYKTADSQRLKILKLEKDYAYVTEKLGKTEQRLLKEANDLDTLCNQYNRGVDRMARQRIIISRLHKLYHTQHAIIKELKKRQANPIGLSMTCFKVDPNMDIRIQEVKVREQLAIDLHKLGFITFAKEEFKRPEMNYPEIKVTATINVAKIQEDEKRV